MDEWKSLNTLICEYIEAQKRLEQAIERNRAQAANQTNFRNRMQLDRACEAMRLEYAALTQSITQMKQIVKERESDAKRHPNRKAVWPDCDCPDRRLEH